MAESSLPLEATEFLNDAFALDIISSLMENIENIYLKKYLGDYLLFFGSIFTEEVIKAGFGDKGNVSEEIMDIINDLRMKNLKCSPTVSSEHIAEKVKDMGIDFDYYVFDSIITVGSDNTLYDINFRTWEYANIDKEYFSKLNRIAITAPLWSEKMLVQNLPFLNTYKELIILILKEKVKELKFDYKPYPTSKLFANIPKEERLYLAQRYGLAKSINFIEKLLENIPVLKIEIMNIDINAFLRKSKAVLFSIMWNDYKNTKFKIIEEIFKKNKLTIPDEFYPINTKVRNNLHYSKTDILNEKELTIFDSASKEYIENILNVFNKNISVKFNFFYKIALSLAERQFKKEREKK